MDQHIFIGRLPREMMRVCSLAWTPSQDGLTYGLRRHWQSNAETADHEVIHVSVDGIVTTIAKISRERFEDLHELTYFHVTRDKKHVIVSNGYTPQIWDVTEGRPRATCFDRMVPSETSGRFLGIEIDTRQLVIADKDFRITDRFNVVFQVRRMCDLIWSRDERFAICRTRHDHPSEKWTGLRINLETGEQRPLEGSFFSERFRFTGRGGEVVRTGKTQDLFGVYADGGGWGTRISIVPDGGGEERDIYRFARPIKSYEDSWHRRGRYPPVRLSRDCQLFAMALPRDVGKTGFQYFLLDRKGNRWSLSVNDDASEHVSPYRVVAIVNNGHTILAWDDTKLFSVPVANILKSNSPDAK